MQKTPLVKEEERKNSWVLVDLEGQVLGRAATRIADILRGKNKTTYTPHVDTGDFVVVINAQKVQLTGKKLKDKIYYHHTGFRGGIKQITAEKRLIKEPSGLIEDAVFGMLPKNRMAKHLMRKLKVYALAEHPHSAQQPKPVKI